MQHISYTCLEDIERDKAEMEAFRESLNEKEKVSSRSSHDDEFYCGICGWSHISTYPHSH